MWKTEIFTFDNKAHVLQMIGNNAEKRIRSIQALNNTPFYLYFGTDQMVNRDTALFVVEPYTDLIMPINIGQHVYVNQGPPIGRIPSGVKAVLSYGDEVRDAFERRYKRQVIIDVIEGTQTEASLIAQSIYSSAFDREPTVFAIPAAAERVSIFGTANGTWQTVDLYGSFDNKTFFPFQNLAFDGQQKFIANMAFSTFPPYMQIRVINKTATESSIKVVIDL